MSVYVDVTLYPCHWWNVYLNKVINTWNQSQLHQLRTICYYGITDIRFVCNIIEICKEYVSVHYVTFGYNDPFISYTILCQVKFKTCEPLCLRVRYDSYIYISVRIVSLKYAKFKDPNGKRLTNHVYLPLVSDHLSWAAALMFGRSRQVSLYSMYINLS